MASPNANTAYTPSNAAGRGLGLLAVWVMAVAWPWELFQRIPFLEITLVKLAAVVILVAAAYGFLRNRLWRNGAWRQYATGLEAPLALMACACVLSLAVSMDRTATLAQLQQYAQYLLLFYALVYLLGNTRNALYIGQSFVVSASLVAILALACAAGWAFPTLATPNEFQGFFIRPELRSGALMRMAATTDDFNQGVLCFLLAFPMAIFLFLGKNKAIYANIIGLCCAMLLLAGIVVSFSRSSLLALGLMLLLLGYIGLHTRVNRRTVLLGGGVLLLLALPMLALYHEALLQRFLRGILTRDASYESRLYVFEVGWQILPRYLWLGTGLGASDTAIQAVADPNRLQGITTHSVPFKLLLETGILGCLAYFWLWFRLVRQTWRQGLLSIDPQRRRLGLALLCAYTGAFFVMLVQPFMALSLFPLLAALSRGPLRDTSPATATHQRTPFRWSVVILSALVSALVSMIVGFNIISYQQVGKTLDKYATTLLAAYHAEMRGNMMYQKHDYKRALVLATYSAEVPNDPIRQAAKMRDLPYYDIARNVPDFHYLHRSMALGTYPRDPVAIGWLGLARVSLMNGEYEDARGYLDAVIALEPEWAAPYFYRGRAAWRDGAFSEAVAAYAQAAELAGDWRNHEYAQRLEGVEDQLASIQVRSCEPEAWVQAGILELLLQLGRWEDACAIAEATEHQAESQFYLGVDRLMAGEENAARQHFEESLRITPGHLEAQKQRE